MPRVQFIGQISLSFGNTLPELCSKLKNFGTGRMFVRTAKDQNREVSYVVLTQSRPVVTATPPKATIGSLNEISAITRRPPDTQSEFYARIVEHGTVLNGGQSMKVSSVTNPDWRLIRKEDEDYFLKNTLKTEDASKTKRDSAAGAASIQEHIPDIIKFWARAKS